MFCEGERARESESERDREGGRDSAPKQLSILESRTRPKGL